MENPDVIYRYFREHVNQGFSKILNEQRVIAIDKIYGHKTYDAKGRKRSRSGRLKDALESPTMSLSGAGAELRGSIDYPYYIRFLDMKRMGNLKIYNRPIWGILYKETFQDIRYQFASWLRENFKKDITDALKN